MSLAILFHFLCAQHVSDINISMIRSLRLCCWITTSVVLFSVRCVLEIWCSWFWVVFVLQAEVSACKTNTTQNQPHKISNTQRTENKTTDVVTQQHSGKLLMMDILMSETCWAHKKWNKIASDITLVFHSSTVTMMHGPINIRYRIIVLNVNCIFVFCMLRCNCASCFWIDSAMSLNIFKADLETELHQVCTVHKSYRENEGPALGCGIVWWITKASKFSSMQGQFDCLVAS